MDLSPEERKRIYEEEKARVEAETQPATEEAASLKMDPKVAALLCYLGLWVTGIIFVVLETKNRYVRFHAIQSIVVFGFLFVAGALLQPIPYAGGFFGAAIGLITLVLWIVLMVKGYQGELYKIPLAGDLAEKMAGEPAGETTLASARPDEPAETVSVDETTRTASEEPLTGVAAAAPPVKTATVASDHKGRNGRITASAFTIVWGIFWLIVFNCLSQYIAYYQPEVSGDVSRWVAYPLLTGEFDRWLPVVNTVIGLSIAGHIILIMFDKYVLRESVTIVLNVFTIVAIATLLALFPFDFSRIPYENAAAIGSILLSIILLVVIIGIAIGTLVSFIKLIINLVTRNIAY